MGSGVGFSNTNKGDPGPIGPTGIVASVTGTFVDNTDPANPIVNNIKNNPTAGSDPTVNDDSGDGYSIGSTWATPGSPGYFVAQDVTVGAAIWVKVAAQADWNETDNTLASFILNKPASLVFAKDTYANWKTLRDANALPEGEVIEITDASGTDKGVIIQCATVNKFDECTASGGFLNADYQQRGDYSGVLAFTSVAIANYIGVWTIQYGSASPDEGDIVIWDNDHYQLTSLIDADGTDPATNTAAYTLFPRATANLGYIEQWDALIYNFWSDRIEWRMDKRGNKIPYSALSTIQWGDNNTHDVVVDSNTINSLNLLNSTGSITGRVFGNNASVNISQNRGTVFFDLSGSGQTLYAPLNFGTLEIHVSGVGSGASGINNGGDIKLYINDQSTVIFDNNSGDIYGRYADAAVVNHSNNTQDIEFIDCTNGYQGAIAPDHEIYKDKFIQSDTYANWASLRSLNRLPKGQFIIINDKADLGLRLFVETNNTFSLDGTGLFLNPDFQNVGDYSGVFAVTGVAYGATIGIWTGAGESGTSDGDVVFWGGLHYQVTDSGAFDGTTDPASNTAAYTVLSKTDANVGYRLEADYIDYNFSSDLIMCRKDKRYNEVHNYSSSSGFQFGNNTTIRNIAYGDFYNVNSLALIIASNYIDNGVTIDVNSFVPGSFVINNKIYAGATTVSLTFINGLFTFFTNNTLTPTENILFDGSDGAGGYQGEVLNKLGSTLNSYLDSTGIVAIDLGTTEPFIGIVNIQKPGGGDTAETITSLLNFPLNRPVRIQPSSFSGGSGDLTLTFTSGTGANDPHCSGGVNAVLDSGKGDWIEFTKKETKISSGVYRIYQTAGETYG